MKNLMHYKDYYGTVEYSDEDEVFFGKIAFIRDLVSYEGQSVSEIKQAFHEAVDDYLELCASQGRKPDVPFKGTFNVRIGEELHRKVAVFAENHEMSLNMIVQKALQHYVGDA